MLEGNNFTKYIFLNFICTGADIYDSNIKLYNYSCRRKKVGRVTGHKDGRRKKAGTGPAADDECKSAEKITNCYTFIIPRYCLTQLYLYTFSVNVDLILCTFAGVNVPGRMWVRRGGGDRTIPIQRGPSVAR